MKFDKEEKEVFKNWRLMAVALAGIMLGVWNMIHTNQKTELRFTSADWEREDQRIAAEKAQLRKEVKENRQAIDALVAIVTDFAVVGPVEVRRSLDENQEIDRQNLRQLRENNQILLQILKELRED